MLACVIASGAKESSSDAAALDCFVVELIIGRVTSGRTHWLLAMMLLLVMPALVAGVHDFTAEP